MVGKSEQSTRKRKDIVTLLATVFIIILINFICSYFFKRFDLTTEKRYTLSNSTIDLLKKLDDVVYLKVYLQGDFNPSFTRLRNETKEWLEEIKDITSKSQ